MKRFWMVLALVAGCFAAAVSSPLLAGDACCSPPLISDAPGYQYDSGFDTVAIENFADWQEPDWSEWLARQMGLDPDESCEVRTHDGSWVDILTRREAAEVEWSEKWKEAPAQATLYAIQTHRDPAVILLSKGDDARFIQRCQAVCAKLGIRLYVQKIPDKNRTESAIPEPPAFGLQFKKPVHPREMEPKEQPNSALWRHARRFSELSALPRLDNVPVGRVPLL